MWSVRLAFPFCGLIGCARLRYTGSKGGFGKYARLCRNVAYAKVGFLNPQSQS